MNENKKIFSNELAYILALLTLAFGTALMEAANFGVSMVVAPAYILHLKISQFLPFFSFGMAEYSLQAVLLIVTILVMRRFKLSYLFSFVTAVLYGFTLDAFIRFVGLIPCDSVPVRVLFYLVGMLFCSIGVSLFFHSYISPEAYELFVKEISGRMQVDIHKFKTVYDCVSCLVSVLLSFAFFGFGSFVGIGVGTLVSAILNGLLVGLFHKLYSRLFDSGDLLPLRRFFE